MTSASKIVSISVLIVSVEIGHSVVLLFNQQVATVSFKEKEHKFQCIFLKFFWYKLPINNGIKPILKPNMQVYIFKVFNQIYEYTPNKGLTNTMILCE